MIGSLFRRFVYLTILAFPAVSPHAFAGGLSFSSVSIDGQELSLDAPQAELRQHGSFLLCFEGNVYHYLSSRYEEVAVHFWLETANGRVTDYTLETIEIIDPSPYADPLSFEGAVSRCFRWRAPGEPGEYRLFSHRVPIIAPPSAFGSDADRAALARENRDEQWGRFEVAQINVTDEANTPELPYSLILKVNGQTPGASVSVSGGVTEDPLDVSWIVREKPLDQDVEVQAQYSLYPSTDWSAWTSDRTASFDFVMKGVHEFRLRTRYRSGTGDWLEIPQVSRIGFTLDETLIAPITSKGLKPESAVDPGWIEDELYGRSRAFVAGVSVYDNDSEFRPLPFIDNDISALTGALENVGFDEITGPGLNADRASTLNALQSFIASTEPGDRLILYFSMHGFESGTDRQNPYLATRDCDPSPLRVKSNCLPLSDIEELVKYAVGQGENGKGAKHVLVILDACSVGMGIIRKNASSNGRFFEYAIANVPGAHIMTAGLANQEALVDNTEQISYFTRALVEGLEGQADVFEDGVITLSELEVFVRRQVARASNSTQTPMVGDISGAGQIVFRAPAVSP